VSASKVLVSAPQCRRITAGLAKVAGHFTGQVVRSGDIADPGERGRLVRSATDLVLVDGHWRDYGEIDGVHLGRRDQRSGIRARILIAGCCCSGESGFTDAVRAGLDRPVAYLGCGGIALYEHADLVFIPVLRALLNAGLGGSVDSAKDIINEALGQVRAEHPRMTSLARWNAIVLQPRK
jgi:hypothetical protein